VLEQMDDELKSKVKKIELEKRKQDFNEHRAARQMQAPSP